MNCILTLPNLIISPVYKSQCLYFLCWNILNKKKFKYIIINSYTNWFKFSNWVIISYYSPYSMILLLWNLFKNNFIFITNNIKCVLLVFNLFLLLLFFFILFYIKKIINYMFLLFFKKIIRLLIFLKPQDSYLLLLF